jgi:dTDP-4-dehydrorhamnose 3,5-epimerase
MQFVKSAKLGLTTIIPDIKEDHRGTFVELYNEAESAAPFHSLHFVRDCISTSSRHVLRGLHYDDKTWKLIQCLAGKIYFVVVNLQPLQTGYLQWESFILSEYNRLQVLVPPRYGNGHLVLSETCTFHYKMTEYYDPANEKILKWDDPQAKIYWPVTNPILSPKDALGFNPSYRSDQE